MKILAIETSCDDTCASVLEIKDSGFKILSNIVSSQNKIHKKYGGVYPFMAKREHQKNLAPVLIKALKEANLLYPKLGKKNEKLPQSKKNFLREKSIIQNLNKFLAKKIDLIAVAIGPGLEPCLWTGANFVKDIAKKLKLPIVPVNHIEAHIMANFISQNPKLEIKNNFPAMCLIASGGHTQLILMKKIGKYKVIGETRDDAAGECFDKTARILGLGYPGGPKIALEAAKLKIKNSRFNINLPRPMICQKNYDFSFSGLKTAVLYKTKSAKKKAKSKKYTEAMAAEIQQAIIDVLIKKTIKAAKDYKAKTIILGGGVTANKELRKQFEEKIKKDIPLSKFHIPEAKYSTDNAAMIAIAGYFNRHKKISWKKLKVSANLRI